MESAYIAVHLWAKAVESAGSDDVGAIRRAINDQSFDAPEGKVTIDPQTHHVSKFVRIGKITEDGQFQVVYCSDAPIPPIPYPATRSKNDWDGFVNELHLRWGGQWTNPEPAKSARDDSR
jgi:urea transport system substrate-binding protein